MITNSSIRPHSCLNDFIVKYTLCESESKEINMTFPMYANHESCLYFSLGDQPKQVNIAITKNVIISISKVSFFGLLTHANGTMKMQGKCTGFIIEFKPNGFNRLFGIAANEICDNNFPADEILGNGVKYLYEQLLDAVNIQDMALLSDRFLIGFLNRKKTNYTNEGITKISSLLLTTFNKISIAKYACQANMSMRNFERRFTEQVGIPPKLFCRLLRFNSAIQFKITHPKKSWTEIAYESGYYDSMHMIKEFKQFTNKSPAAFFNGNPDLMNESFSAIDRTES